jgi:hypothetical protein
MGLFTRMANAQFKGSERSTELLSVLAHDDETSPDG